uniref:Progestin and adipoQ receptor family member Va n=1 Tax=Cyprinus carpio TaxID=7962 RepID=A0A8C2L1Y4_CYPCA
MKYANFLRRTCTYHVSHELLNSAKDCVFSLFQNRFFCKVFLMETADGRITFTWPFLVFLLSCCVYPLASSCAHTFSTMSERARHICFFFDYGALSFYSLDKWINCTFHTYYVPIADVNCKLFKVLLIGRPAFFCRSLCAMVRVAPLMRPVLFTISTSGCLHWLTFCHTPVQLQIPAFLFKQRIMNLDRMMLVGIFQTSVNSKLWFFNASFTCQNHQLFHVFGITGTHFQMTAIDLDMAAPKQWLHAHLLPVTLSNTAGAAFFSVVSGLCIVYCMSSVWDFSLLEV